MRTGICRLFLVLSFAVACFLGCEENAFIGEGASNKAPSIRLTGGPLEGDTTSYRIEFSWIGSDVDGRIDCYEYVLCDGDLTGFDPADTTGLDKWRSTVRTDSTFAFSADQEEDEAVRVGENKYTVFYKRVHTFFVRAVDDRGGRSEAAYRSFTARTLAPYAVIDYPKNPFPGHEQSLPTLFKLHWTGEDPIDETWNIQEPESTRHLLLRVKTGILDSLNKNPESFEKYWTPWMAYDAPGDSGTTTVIGDDELITMQGRYMFAVQAKDDAGAVTSVFNAAENVRLFVGYKSPGPMLQVTESHLGVWMVLGANNSPVAYRVPAGFPLEFSWSANASSYGGEVSSYQYGWDIVDLSDPNEWDVEASPYVKSAPSIVFQSGVHTLYIKAEDNLGSTTLFSFEASVFTLTMRKNLLWVDDFYSTDYVQDDYAFPTKSEHMEFWLGICSRAKNFDATADVYVTASQSFQIPDIELLWNYKNIIWSYTSSDNVMAWDNMIRFTPESLIGQSTTRHFDYLSYYMASGGHVWTEGKGDERGGLGAVLLPAYRSFPVNLRCESAGIRTGCNGDTSGVNGIAYKAYCVTVLDKVKDPVRKGDNRLPARNIDYDAMAAGFKDTTDAITTAHPGLPADLTLWSKVTADKMFFDPKVRGFWYVEIYDPKYWMKITGAASQSCLHPMYRMRARNAIYSPINGAVIAFWTTKYADVQPDIEGAVAAPCVHFGIPLWFFNRTQANAIADVIFKEWHISAM
ncbi:MAG: hypothetical protein PHD74_00685 [Candidatus Krumholzibacteria bacterium]|nr:hypothetical protein [Candidatus Krumholzibacteria bacterium]